jgi:hypothetical protein
LTALARLPLERPDVRNTHLSRRGLLALHKRLGDRALTGGAAQNAAGAWIP